MQSECFLTQLDNSIETLSRIRKCRDRGWRNMVNQWFRECAALGSQGDPTQPAEEPEEKPPEEKKGES